MLRYSVVLDILGQILDQDCSGQNLKQSLLGSTNQCLLEVTEIHETNQKCVHGTCISKYHVQGRVKDRAKKRKEEKKFSGYCMKQTSHRRCLLKRGYKILSSPCILSQSKTSKIVADSTHLQQNNSVVLKKPSMSTATASEYT